MTLSGGEVVCKVDGRPDGTKLDADGNIYTTSSGNLQILIKMELCLEISMFRDSAEISALAEKIMIICILPVRQSGV